MHLINTRRWDLERVAHCGVKKYAILSHRWTDEEVTFKNFDTRAFDVLAGPQSGLLKIEAARKRAAEDGMDYVWVDTCCIDKTSSAELSEAINSMYHWYREAEVCYAYLFDVPDDADPFAEDGGAFAKSEWFRRGWTLQELVAPREIVFFSRGWVELGTKRDLKEVLAGITKIDVGILEGTKDLGSVSVARRMSWAATRETSRPEDGAYCLMGLFNVNMPMLYGEGGEKAFVRLQEQIMQETDDETIFAWRSTTDEERKKEHGEDALYGLLATSPRYFADSGQFVPYSDWERRPPFAKTNKGLQISLRLTHFAGDIYQAALNCPVPSRDFTGYLAIFLKRIEGFLNPLKPQNDYRQYARVRVGELSYLKESGLVMTKLYVRQNPVSSAQSSLYPKHLLQLGGAPIIPQGYEFVNTLGRRSNDKLQIGRTQDGQLIYFWHKLPNHATHAFVLPKGEKMLAAVLIFERPGDQSKLAVFVGSAANSGITIGVQEDWANEEFDMLQRNARLRERAGEEIKTSREIVSVDFWPYIEARTKYYIVNITVTAS